MSAKVFSSGHVFHVARGVSEAENELQNWLPGSEARSIMAHAELINNMQMFFYDCPVCDGNQNQTDQTNN